MPTIFLTIYFFQISGKHVVLIAQRRILHKLKQKRPCLRTLVAVHSAILDDHVYAAEIVICDYSFFIQ